MDLLYLRILYVLENECMKFLSNLFFIVVCHSIVCDPLLVVVLMVKNEASVIEATVQPFIEGGVRDFVIFDTGSTDGTQAIAADFFKRHAILNAHIIEEPFIDFATSRNHALEAAERLFPDAVFMLMPDAEWYINNASALLQFCKCIEYGHCGSYLVKIQNDFSAFYTPRLIRCHKNIRFVGRVHEILNEVSSVGVPDAVFFEWHPSHDGLKKSQQRWQRDRDLLLKSYAEDQYDCRTLFYLGQTYACLEDWENAYTYYTRRAALKGWEEEDYETFYRLGAVAQRLNVQKDALVPLPVQYYLKAFSLRPHRAEPLVQIAQYYIAEDEMELAFLYAARAVQLPYPTQDILFVDKYMYECMRYDVLGTVAWYVGEYELGEWAIRQALAREPHSGRLHTNLQYYTQFKSEQTKL